jgi:hypothetical protein
MNKYVYGSDNFMRKRAKVAGGASTSNVDFK